MAFFVSLECRKSGLFCRESCSWIKIIFIMTNYGYLIARAVIATPERYLLVYTRLALSRQIFTSVLFMLSYVCLRRNGRTGEGVIIIVSANYSSAGGLTGDQFVTHVTLASPNRIITILCCGTSRPPHVTPFVCLCTSWHGRVETLVAVQPHYSAYKMDTWIDKK